MDVQSLVAATQDYSKLDSDAVALVLPADRAAWQLPAALRKAVDEAVQQGDLALKAGRTLYLHRPAGLKTARLVVAIAADGAVKAWRKAVDAALAALKAGGAARVALVWGGSSAVTAALPEAVLAWLQQAC